jgi:hypothetical protein
MIKALNAMFETEQYLDGAFFAICFKVSFARIKTLRLHASVHPYQAKVRLKWRNSPNQALRSPLQMSLFDVKLPNHGNCGDGTFRYVIVGGMQSIARLNLCMRRNSTDAAANI